MPARHQSLGGVHRVEVPQSERCRTVQISKAKLDTASAACEGGLVAHDRSGVFYWGSRVSAVWELVRAEPTSLTLATKPHRGGAVTGDLLTIGERLVHDVYRTRESGTVWYY